MRAHTLTGSAPTTAFHVSIARTPAIRPNTIAQRMIEIGLTTRAVHADDSDCGEIGHDDGDVEQVERRAHRRRCTTIARV
jgi:hypothetical protein